MGWCDCTGWHFLVWCIHWAWTALWPRYQQYPPHLAATPFIPSSYQPTACIFCWIMEPAPHPNTRWPKPLTCRYVWIWHASAWCSRWPVTRGRIIRGGTGGLWCGLGGFAWWAVAAIPKGKQPMGEGWNSWVRQLGPPEHLNSVNVDPPVGSLQPHEVVVLDETLQQWMQSSASDEAQIITLWTYGLSYVQIMYNHLF